MKIFEQAITIPFPSDGTESILAFVSDHVKQALPPDSHPIRFAITESTGSAFELELGIIDPCGSVLSLPNAFELVKRKLARTDRFNAVMLVPTGIGAAIGGHAGDAAPTARLLAGVCDNLVTHPNVVNASDINEMSENTLYAEGSVVSRFLMGQIGLQKVRSNRIITVVEQHPTDQLFVNGAINAVNAARAAGGLDCKKILVSDSPVRLIAEYSQSGRAAGRVENIEPLIDELRSLEGEFDAVAFSSIIKIPTRRLHAQYFESRGEMVNPWGGVEAIFTHAISSIFNIQSAHSPMIEDQLVSNMDVGVVDARLAAEAVSFTYMHCILKGLQRAPRIITDRQSMTDRDVLTAEDISCVVIPDGCIGIPTLAALEQGIPVIAVRGNRNLMRNNLRDLPWAPDQLHVVENYFEAVGMMAALKAGIAMQSLARPMVNAQLDETNVSKGLRTRNNGSYEAPQRVSVSK